MRSFCYCTSSKIPASSYHCLRQWFIDNPNWLPMPFSWQIIKMYSFLDYIMGGCQIQFTVNMTLKLKLLYICIRLPLSHRSHFAETVSISFRILGGNRLYSIQRGSEEQLLPPLHPSLPAQWVPQSSSGCWRDLPRLWQVESTPSIIIHLMLTYNLKEQRCMHGFSPWGSNRVS